MSDIVERLRKANSRVLLGGMNEQPVFLSAMQEIERLRAEVAALKGNAEPVAWMTDAAGLIRYVTDSKYQKFSDVIKRYYKPYTYPRIPEGWVMVPKEPTPAMEWYLREYDGDRTLVEIYRAMIAAAPKPHE